jgi:hypothetical protein
MKKTFFPRGSNSPRATVREWESLGKCPDGSQKNGIFENRKILK